MIHFIMAAAYAAAALSYDGPLIFAILSVSYALLALES
jgi:hypothetical protein